MAKGASSGAGTILKTPGRSQQMPNTQHWLNLINILIHTYLLF